MKTVHYNETINVSILIYKHEEPEKTIKELQKANINYTTNTKHNAIEIFIVTTISDLINKIPSLKI